MQKIKHFGVLLLFFCSWLRKIKKKKIHKVLEKMRGKKKMLFPLLCSVMMIEF